LTNSILIRPLINFFSGEFEGAKYRGTLTSSAADKKNAGQVKMVIIEALEAFKKLNPEALECRNGTKVPKPSWKIQEEE